MTPDEIDRLSAVDAITRLKGAYFRLMDARDWTAWADVLTEDCVMTLAGEPPVVLDGRDAIVASAQRNLDPRVGMHLGHMPEIEVAPDGTATGHWTLLAYSTRRPEPGASARSGMMSLGRYVDRYRRCEDRRWRIAATSLNTVLRVLGDDAAGETLAPADGLTVGP